MVRPPRGISLLWKFASAGGTLVWLWSLGGSVLLAAGSGLLTGVLSLGEPESALIMVAVFLISLGGLLALLPHVVPARRIKSVPAASGREQIPAGPDESSPLARLTEMMEQTPTLQRDVEHAYGEQALDATRKRVVSWCLEVEHELHEVDEESWLAFRERGLQPGKSVRIDAEGVTDPHWDHIDSRALLGFLRNKKQTLGYALAKLRAAEDREE